MDVPQQFDDTQRFSIFRDLYPPLFEYRLENVTTSTINFSSSSDDDDPFRNFFARTSSYDNNNMTSRIPMASDSKTMIMRIFVGLIELLVFFVGTPANLLVLYLTYEIFRRRARNPNADGHIFQSGQLFVFTMTLFDLLFCLVHSPLMFTMLILIDRWPLSFDACIVMYLITHTSTTGSSLSLLALNVEKFIRLYKPLHYRTIVTQRRALVAVGLIWLISCGWGVFLMFGPFMENKQSLKGQCYQQLLKPGVYVFFASIFFVMPTLVSLAISGFTLLAALRTRKHRKAWVVVKKKSNGGEDGCGGGSIKMAKKMKTKSSERKESMKKQLTDETNMNDRRQPEATPLEQSIGQSKLIRHVSGSITMNNGSPLKSLKVDSLKLTSRNPPVMASTNSKLLVHRKSTELESSRKSKNSCLSLMAFVGFVFTTTIWSSLTILPYRMGYLWSISHPYDVACMFVLLALMVLNSAGNPFITIVTKRQYSNRVRRMCGWVKMGKKSWNTSSVLSGGDAGGVGGKEKVTVTVGGKQMDMKDGGEEL